MKLLKIHLFGTLLQLLYKSEINFTIEWMWDGGIDWSFSQVSFSGRKEHRKKIQETIEEFKGDEMNDMEVIGGLIIAEYLEQYNGKNSEGELNELGKFLIAHGFLNYEELFGTDNPMEYYSMKMREYEDTVRPAIRYLNDNIHPHSAIIVTQTSAELMEGNMIYNTNQYIKD